MATRRKQDNEVEQVEGTEAPVGVAVGSHTAVVDITNGQKAIKFHSPPSAIIPAVDSAVTGTGIGANAVVVASPAPSPEGFSVSVASTATTASLTATLAQAGAPEQVGALVSSYSDAQANGYWGRRNNTHADAEYTLPGLVDGASPGDWDNKYDAPGGVNIGSGEDAGV